MSLVEEDVIARNITGEFYRPTRLYYKVCNQSQVLDHFKRLECIQYCETRNGYVWLYEKEAQDLHFENSYNRISEEYRPIILGWFSWKSKEDLVLDLRSSNRALHAIPFFHKYISEMLMKVTHCAVVNKIFSLKEVISQSYFDQYFENNDQMVIVDLEAGETHLKEFAEEVKNILAKNFSPERIEEALTRFQKKGNDFFEIEKFPVFFYTDGIRSLESAFSMRNTIMLKRFLGEKDYSWTDLTNEMINKTKDSGSFFNRLTSY